MLRLTRARASSMVGMALAMPFFEYGGGREEHAFVGCRTHGEARTPCVPARRTAARLRATSRRLPPLRCCGIACRNVQVAGRSLYLAAMSAGTVRMPRVFDATQLRRLERGPRARAPARPLRSTMRSTCRRPRRMLRAR